MTEVMQEVLEQAKNKVKKTTKKKVSKKKEAVGTFESTVADIENLTKTKALNMAHKLVEETEFNYFKLGGVLTVIQDNGWWEGYESFREFVENEMNLHYRKALYLIDIYNALLDADLEWDKVQDLGWTKLKVLAKVINKENADEWIERARGMTVIQLEEAVKAYKKTQVTGEGGEEASEVEATLPEKTLTTMTFKVFEDQKETIRMALDKAKEQGNTEFDNVALEYMAVAFLEGSTGKASASSVEAAMKSLGLEDTLSIVGELWPDVNIIVEME